MIVNVKKLVPEAVLPKYAHPGVDMGMDITAISMEYKQDIDCFVYHTGLAFEVPEGYGMLIFPRSSNRKTEAYLPNSVGILDSSYRGELLVCFKNRDSFKTRNDMTKIVSSHTEHFTDINPPYRHGDRVAQLVILPYPQIEFNEVEELSETERGAGGFGSTNG